MLTAVRDIGAFIISRSRKGEKCGECGFTFTADQGDGKTAAIFRNFAGGTSIYVLCNTCGVNYKRHGKLAIPNAWRDSRIASLMHDSSKEDPNWIH
jgi:rubredoxin